MLTFQKTKHIHKWNCYTYQYFQNGIQSKKLIYNIADTNTDFTLHPSKDEIQIKLITNEEIIKKISRISTKKQIADTNTAFFITEQTKILNIILIAKKRSSQKHFQIHDFINIVSKTHFFCKRFNIRFYV